MAPWIVAVLVASVAPAVQPPDCGLELSADAAHALLARHAPLVLIAPGERAWPASVAWALARGPIPDGARSFPSLAEWLRMDAGAGVAAEGFPAPRRPRPRPTPEAWPGSRSPLDWVVYGHAYGAEDGGVLLQYWFYYPFNDFHAVGDHEGDWEHVTVRLGPDLGALGAWYAQHDANAPGEWSRWTELEREGDHPVVLAARGSHASYPEPVSGLDETSPDRAPALAAERGCAVWRTWDASTGGLVEVGTRERPGPGAAFLRWPGRWGARTHFAQLGSSPPGPAHQPGWCSAGIPGTALAPRGAWPLQAMAQDGPPADGGAEAAERSPGRHAIPTDGR